ncbi:MAG TPA: VCBS repeat-containing protein [Flavisolibacter sp.]|nr:VCBS repeat-containing protein [Flavisolibacter sp.]
MNSKPVYSLYNKSCLLLLTGFLLLVGSCSQQEEPKLFEQIASSESGIRFSNNIKPGFDFNILDYNYFYNGGGVCAADFNNDGLTDLYFTGNQVSSKLYLNKGNFVFEDVTEKAGVATKFWATGIAVADVNKDGFQDMYVSYAGYPDPLKRTHQLFIHKGINNGIPLFTDEALAYGLADTSYTTQSAFLDFDKDGDLDLFSINHFQDKTNPNYPLPKVADGNSSSNAKLYRNDGGRFTEISKAAGILDEGYGLGIGVSDINNDGWPDIYVTKDFAFDDVLYINNKNGTFSESLGKYVRHSSQFSMGCDVADYNNDGFTDIVTVDMMPDDNKRQKLMNIAMNNDRFNYALSLGHMPQYTRNMLQLNNGPDANGNFSFSEIGQLAGIYKTDWSWSALFADFDNDGWKDLYISNGIPRDITNNDFISYRSQKIMDAPNADFTAMKTEMLNEIDKLEPVNKPNFVFQNNRNLGFDDKSEAWGLAEKGFSNGAVYVDLDNDGDLDLVTNNLNAEASVFKNKSELLTKNNFLRVRLDGDYSIGARLFVTANGTKQFIEHNPIRGFQSSQDPVEHFGLGKNELVDTLKVMWLDGKQQTLVNVKVNQLLTLRYEDSAFENDSTLSGAPSKEHLFTDITAETGIDFLHTQLEFEDFNLEPLLPHRYSQNGPFITVGDVDGNGLEDFWVGGPARVPGKLFLQGQNGKFSARDMPDPGYEDMGGVLFDADGDKDLDLYVVSGGNAYNPLSAPYQDRLYINDGKGNFAPDEQALPVEYNSGSCVLANDFDKDGDIDLFVGGRVVPTKYGITPQSFLLKNNGKGKFENVTPSVCPGLQNVGMVTAATWTDFDKDGWTDLIVTGEWMPLCFFKNDGGTLRKVSTDPEVDAANGWWFSIAAADFDEDGDMDYVLGNLGLNNKFQPSARKPVSVYAKDFDGNGTLEPILTYYLGNEEFTIANRDQISSVMPVIKKKFDTYTKFSEAAFGKMFSEEEKEDAIVLRATTFASVYLENTGNGKFKSHELPARCQFAPIQSMKVSDFDGDGHLDVLMAGNFYGPEFTTGRYDASIGMFVKGDGKGNFKPLPAAESGIHIKGDARVLAEIKINNRQAFLAGINKGQLQVYTGIR